MEVFRHVPEFLSDDEVNRLTRLIQDQEDLYTEVHGRGGLGPRYRVIDGDQIHEKLPELKDLGLSRVQPLAEKLAGRSLKPLGSSKRSMRVQAYERREHGFRWHLDGHAYVVLVALKNTNGGQTQFLSPSLTRFLRFLLYPLYAVPQVFSIFPRRSVTMAPGDLLWMRGARAIHRGITLSEEGERILVAYTFDPPDKKPNPFRDWIARRLNY
ncbi:MAG TPA: hypothetical protein VGS22_17750 [Thermoanaerobaculia bacterium]|jgi:hypothetical protein|nr:hypothetical protein [Thermoanaerobaculia bacterium]